MTGCVSPGQHTILTTMIIGHFAIAGILKQTWFERQNLLFLSVVGFGPDFVDKPLNMLFGLSGRCVGHSLLFYLAVILIACCFFYWLNFSSRTLFAGIVMWGTHIIGDFLAPQVLFWPFLGEWEPSSRFHVFQKLWQFYVDRLYFAQFWMEIACIAILVALLLTKAFVSSPPPQEIMQVSKLPSSDRNL